MEPRLRELNPLSLAAAWLNAQDSEQSYTPEDLLELAREQKIQLLAVVPDWQEAGEIPWAKLNRTIIKTENGEFTSLSASPVYGFIATDGRVVVTSEMARRLLDHGKCSLDCVRMPIIDCSIEPLATSEACLHGIGDGRMITMEHIRVTRSELHKFTSVAYEGSATTIKENSAPAGVSKAKILGAPWQYPVGFYDEKLRRLLEDCPAWITEARVSKGVRGKSSATWNPAVLAMLLKEKKGFALHRLTRVINSHFADHIEQWNRYKESLPDD